MLHLSQAFLDGLSWTYVYSTTNLASETWAYEYPIAPLASDLMAYMRQQPGGAPARVLPAEPDTTGRTAQALLHLLITPRDDRSSIRHVFQGLHALFGARLLPGHNVPKVRRPLACPCALASLSQ